MNGFDSDLFDKISSGLIQKLDIPIEAGVLLWKACGTTAWATPWNDEWGIHWEIFSEEGLFPYTTPAPKATFEPTIDGDVEWTEGAQLTLRGVSADTQETWVDKEVVVAVDRCSHTKVPDAEFAKIQWSLSVDGEEAPLVEKGKRIKFKVKSEHDGKKLLFMPYMVTPERSVAVEIVVGRGQAPSWVYVEDCDDDFVIDPPKVKELFKEELADCNITQSELINFYKNNPGGKVERLRYYACRFRSEWSVEDVKKTAKKIIAQGSYHPSPFALLGYNWWSAACNAGVPIPRDACVWHCHPVKVLEVLKDEDENAGLSNYKLKWIEIAEGEIGQVEVEGNGNNQRIIEYHKTTVLKATNDETPWCSSFVNWCMTQAGYEGTNSARAKDWVDWGTLYTKPVYGSVAIIDYGNGGHVGFVVGKTLNGSLILLGGNQGKTGEGSVNMTPFGMANMIGYVLPVECDRVCFDIPLMNLNKDVGTYETTR